MNKSIIICAVALFGLAAFAVSRHVKTPPKEPNDNAVSAKSETAAQEPAFLPFGEASNAAKIAQCPVTNGEYAQFVKETGHEPPRYWKNGNFPEGKEKHPVLWVSLRDAEAYCAWLGKNDAAHTYRLPTEAEWESAAGATPHDAYQQTKTACGALDMWGNCWEWTSTEIVARNGAERGKTVNAIKGGSWYANKSSCRTDYSGEVCP